MLYSLVFGEGLVNDATSVVLFNAIQNFDLVHIDAIIVFKFLSNFCYLFITSTFLGAFVSSFHLHYLVLLYRRYAVSIPPLADALGLIAEDNYATTCRVAC